MVFRRKKMIFFIYDLFFFNQFFLFYIVRLLQRKTINDHFF